SSCSLKNCRANRKRFRKRCSTKAPHFCEPLCIMKTTNQLTNSVNRSHVRLAFLLIPLACFVLSAAHAVDPPPDGGYPNQNTAEGEDALFSLTIGTDNTAIGYQALFRNTRGHANTANGSAALYRNSTGDLNTATGFQALSSNNTGIANTGIGANALLSNT